MRPHDRPRLVFVHADFDDETLRVVVAYDPQAGYGHPDHVHAHRATTAAVAVSHGAEYSGEPWPVPNFYWRAMSKRRCPRRSDPGIEWASAAVSSSRLR